MINIWKYCGTDPILPTVENLLTKAIYEWENSYRSNSKEAIEKKEELEEIKDTEYQAYIKNNIEQIKTEIGDRIVELEEELSKNKKELATLKRQQKELMAKLI